MDGEEILFEGRTLPVLNSRKKLFYSSHLNHAVTITVVPVNDPPVAIDDFGTTEEDDPVTIPVLSNDSDIDGDALTVSHVTDPPNGSVTTNDDGTITYTPDPGFDGMDSFVYTISDGNDETDTATGVCVCVCVCVLLDGVNGDSALGWINLTRDLLTIFTVFV